MLSALRSRVASVAVVGRGAVRASSTAPTGTTAAWGKEFDWSTFVLKSDQSVHGMKLYHKLNFALIGLGPLALLLSPSSMNFPVDMLLGFAIPLHGHIGGNDVISDYAKKVTKAKWFEMGLRQSLLGVTVVTLLGLTKLNLTGVGVTESFKSVWRPRE